MIIIKIKVGILILFGGGGSSNRHILAIGKHFERRGGKVSNGYLRSRENMLLNRMMKWCAQETGSADFIALGLSPQAIMQAMK